MRVSNSAMPKAASAGNFYAAHVHPRAIRLCAQQQLRRPVPQRDDLWIAETGGHQTEASKQTGGQTGGQAGRQAVSQPASQPASLASLASLTSLASLAS